VGAGPRRTRSQAATCPPNGIAMNNQRETFRLDVENEDDLFIEVRSGVTSIPVRPITLSLTGIFIEPCKGGMLTLTSGRMVDLIIEFEGKTIEQSAIVRRREGKGYGLSFGELANTKDAMPEIRKIVMELQRRWLAKHKHLK
jgi:hypothetical protein